MSLSSLIVQREVASMRHVEEALARQVIYGGDLPTNLLEVARLDEGALTAVLAESMHLRPAPAGELPSAPDRVSTLVPAQMAVQRSMIPIALEQDRLVLVVAEGLPRDVEEQLAFALGMGIEQRVAPLVRVRQALARAYGVPLERRMERLIARMAGLPSTAGSMPPPLGAAPAVIEPPRAPSAAPPPRISSRSLQPTRPTLSRTVPPVARDEAEPASSALAVERRAGLLQREPSASSRAARRRRGPLTLDAAKAEAEEEADRDTLLDLFFDFSRQFFDYSALFLVHGDIAEGRDASGSGASRENVMGIGVPLDLPGLMSTAREKRTSSVGKVAADGLDAVLLADLQRSRDAEVAIVPLVVRTRAVALLVGDCAEAGIDRGILQQVVSFSATIGKAFERIIVRRKLDGFIAGNAAAGAGRVDPSLVEAKKPSAPPAVERPTLSAAPAASAPPPAPHSQQPNDALTPPPPPVNIAAVRSIQGPPIPREEPDSPRNAYAPESTGLSIPIPAHSALPHVPVTSSPPAPLVAPTRNDAPISARTPALEVVTVQEEDDDDPGALFDELGWDAPDSMPDGPPPSAAIAVPLHAPANRRPTNAPLPSVIVDVSDEVRGLVERVVGGGVDETAEGDLLRMGERAMGGIMARFPGPVSFDRTRLPSLSNPPRPSDCGPILRLVARQRRVALPFVLERLHDADPEVRGWATYLLTELPYLDALPHLVARLRDEDAAVRAAATSAIGSVARTSPDEVRAAVIEMAHGTDPAGRAAAMRVMGELRSPAIVPDLVRALGDGDETVVEAAQRSLVQVTRQDLGTDARRWLRWWEQNATRNRIEWLIDSLTNEISEIRRAAGDELKALTKEYFGYASDLPGRDRERAQQRYRDWWVTEGRNRIRRGL